MEAEVHCSTNLGKTIVIFTPVTISVTLVGSTQLRLWDQAVPRRNQRTSSGSGPYRSLPDPVRIIDLDFHSKFQLPHFSIV